MAFRTFMTHALLLAYSASSFANPVLSAPVDGPQQTLIREAGLAELKTTLAKNIYRTESYQAEYTEQVPYQTTETYFENVPYTEHVPYTDYEDYWEQEYRCRRETDYRRECRTETECTNRPGRERCEIVNDCRGHIELGAMADSDVEGGIAFLVQGGIVNADNREELRPGRPGRPDRPDRPGRPDRPDCRPRRVCHTEPGGRDCRQVEKCHQVPVSREKCGYESVRKTRPVTKYREETRYRREQRTRTVTKYRTETRCCVTKTREVFDHQWTQPVTVIFPAQATLNAGERESIQLTLTGSEQAPQVNLQILDSVYGYQVLRQDVTPGLIVIELGLTPKYTPGDLGSVTIQGLQLQVPGNAPSSVRFQDNGRKNRVVTNYRVTVLDDADQILTQVQSSAANLAAGWVQIQLPVLLPAEKKLQVLLDVNRQGIVIAGGSTDFQVQTVYTGVLDLNVQKDNSKIKIVDIEGSQDAATLVFQDLAPAHPDVQTTYKISTSRKSGGKTAYMQDRSFDRNDLALGADGNYRLTFRELGVSDANLLEHFASGDSVTVSLEVFRQAPKAGRIPLWQGKTISIR